MLCTLYVFAERSAIAAVHKTVWLKLIKHEDNNNYIVVIIGGTRGEDVK